MRFACILAVAIGALQAQPAFDAVSLKPASPGARGYSIQPFPARLSARNINLKQLIMSAYHVQDYQIAGGPKWIESDAFDLEAKVPDSAAPASEKDLMGMLQKLLADRFSLTIRAENKDLPVYLLQPARNGPKVAQTKDTTLPVVFRVYQRHQITSQNAKFSDLIESLSWILGRPVVDQTGLAATYDYKLEWAPEDLQLRSDEAPVATDSTLPSLGGALQQLGLRMVQQRGPVEMLHIERAEKPAVN